MQDCQKELEKDKKFLEFIKCSLLECKHMTYWTSAHEKM